MKKVYKIDVDCANCANKMELDAKQTPGVKDAIVNFMTLKMHVEFEDGMSQQCHPQVVKNCKRVEVVEILLCKGCYANINIFEIQNICFI